MINNDKCASNFFFLPFHFSKYIYLESLRGADFGISGGNECITALLTVAPVLKVMQLR